MDRKALLCIKDSPGFRYGLVARFCEHGNEPADSRNGGGLLKSEFKLICGTEFGVVIYLSNVIWVPNLGFIIFSLLETCPETTTWNVVICHMSYVTDSKQQNNKDMPLGPS